MVVEYAGFGRQMFVQSDAAARIGYYEALRKSGKNKEESFHEVQLAHPCFTEFLRWFDGPNDANKPLPVELRQGT